MRCAGRCPRSAHRDTYCLGEKRCPGNRFEELRRVLRRRRFENSINGARLHDRALFHHEHLVRDLANHSQVVGDEEVREPELRLQLREQLEDLILNEHVQRRNCLVAHHELRVDRERTRDRDTLPLATRQLPRAALRHSARQRDLVEELGDPCLTRRTIADTEDTQWLVDETLNAVLGSSDPNGSWNTGCIRRRAARNRAPRATAMSSSPRCTVPDVGVSKPSTMRDRVVFPEPDSPTTAVVVPAATSNEMLSTARRIPPPPRILYSFVSPSHPKQRGAERRSVEVRADPAPLPAPHPQRAPSRRRVSRTATSDGAAATSLRVYSSFGDFKISEGVPCSTILPFDITMTLSALIGGKTEIVGDEEERDALRVDERLQVIKDLALHGDVKR